MCHFISIIASDSERQLMETHIKSFGRKGQSLFNKHLQKTLETNEVQILASKNWCDCGTVLGQGLEEEFDNFLQIEKEKMVRKGWSETKIDRVISEKSKAYAKKSSQETDSFEFWSNFILTAMDKNIKKVGVFVHFYSGGLEDEHVTATRRVAAYNSSILESLQTLKEDEVLIFLKKKNLTT